MNQWKIIKLECNQIVFDGVCLKCRLLGSVPDLLSKKKCCLFCFQEDGLHAHFPVSPTEYN